MRLTPRLAVLMNPENPVHALFLEETRDAARQSGVTSSPSVVIGGRIYPGLNDPTVIQQLVEAELAPGVLGRCATTGC